MPGRDRDLMLRQLLEALDRMDIRLSEEVDARVMDAVRRRVPARPVELVGDPAGNPVRGAVVDRRLPTTGARGRSPGPVFIAGGTYRGR